MPTLEEIKKRKQYITYANQTEEKYGLPKNLLVGVMGAESNFNPNAVSHVGAKGLMQFMKATAQEYGINPLNPSESINAAGKYLQSSYKKFGNWEDALRSYNMGVGGLQKVKAGKKSLPKETKDYVGRVYKYAGIKYEDPSYVNTSPQDNNQVQETITPTLNYFNIPKETPTFASVPDSTQEDKKETVEDGVTSKDVAEVEQKTKEYNFLEELQKEDYSHLQPEQVAQQQIVPQVDFNQQYEQVSQFIDEPLVAQQGLTWQEKLANRPRKPTVAEIIAEGDARKVQQRTQVDNTKVSNYNNARVFNPNVRNKTDKEIAQEREAKIQASVEAQKTPYTRENWRQQLASETAATGDKLRVSNEPNFFDDYINPAAMIGSMASNLGQAPLQAQQSDSVMPYVTAIGTPLVTGALAGIGAKTTGQFANNIVNPLAGTRDLVNNLGNKYLPNAYKLNPNAFKPNPEAYYRVIGEAGYKDAIENNIIRPKINSIHSINYPTFKKGVPLDNRYASSEIKGLIGDNSYIVESNGNKMVQNNWTAAAPDKDIFLPRRELKAENEGINFYKKDWLQGYKQVEIPKKPQNFNSEINWGNWNKEIPENTQLMKEYNTIEQTSKANDTWMKNPDGSKFTGTPEQFIQQNSENFKRVFGSSIIKDEKGNPLEMYHGSRQTNIMEFLPPKENSNWSQRTMTNKNNNYNYFTRDKDLANSYRYKVNDGTSDELGDLHSVYIDSKHPLFTEDYSFLADPEDMGKDLTKYDTITNSEEMFHTKPVFTEVAVPHGNNVKSSIGNNGMFDMNNPNIYKSVVPIAGASYLATQGQEESKKFQQGGEFSKNELAFLSEIAIKDNNGYWDKNNQGKVVEIQGGNISMENVDQDLIGIGINKKGKKTEQKTMKAGKNYNFDKAIKVIEIPLFKK